MAITAANLITKFQFAIDNNWGYIWGTSGITWTQAKQNQKLSYLISQYGENWKSNSSAKSDNYYYAGVYGAKWVGHTVADCSGLFVWAYKQLGQSIAHGSNSIYKSYCSSKGKLSKGKRTDGKDLKPGTAVFTGDDSNHGHIGLYVGNGKVIEASGTQAGVIVSEVSLKKWTYWGELKAVDYDKAAETTPVTPSTPTNTTPDVGSAVVNAVRVALRSAPSTSASILTRVDKGERVQVLGDEWTRVTYQGKTGYMMSKFLDM